MAKLSGLHALLLIGCLLPASIQAQGPLRVKIEGVTYDTPEQAEPDLRVKAAAEIAKISPQTDTPYGTLLMVMAAEQEPKIPDNLPSGVTEERVKQMMGLMNLFNRVGYSADADALKQSNLFSDVQFMRADDVAESDFRGAAFKIYAAKNLYDAHNPIPAAFVKEQWTLARADGVSQPLPVAPPAGLPKAAGLQDWVGKVKTALDAIARKSP